MKCFVLTLRDERSKRRFERLRDSLLALGWESPDIIPHYGHNAVDYNDLCEVYNVDTIDFYKNQPENKQTLNRAFSCTAGHVDIWKRIAFGHYGHSIVCEDDIVFKADPRDLFGLYSNNKINWLGPRVWDVDDYSVPHRDFRFLDVERFEGTHAYVVSEGMAQQLYYKFLNHGFNDSIDGQLGMRNIFNSMHQVCDPPIAVAVVGDQQSSINSETAFWNADNTPGFLEGLKPGAKIPPERKIHRLDPQWETERASVLAEIEPNKVAVFLGSGDGNLIREIVDITGSTAYAVGEHHPAVQNNCYLSKFYYNINLVDSLAKPFLAYINQESKRPEIIVITGATDAEQMFDHIALSWIALAPGGKLIIRGIDQSFNQVLTGVNAQCLLNLPTVQLYQKPQL